ncbi:MAG TPA: FAD:protein FMN transferase [Burkholderiaceae bacterium]|nr:FAD:protein FMN transferase [Burkholderiaceae bacterium]
MSLPRRSAFERRARPLLGTIVDIGARCDAPSAPVDAAFAEIAALQRCLSRFDPASDIARFNALPAGACLTPSAATLEVLRAAQAMFVASAGLFDASTGTAPDGWTCRDGRLHKLHPGTQLDLGGIGKGFAVDRAVRRLIEHGATAGWVNAGGDLRVFGDLELPIALRDESSGAARPFGDLADGAFATSCYGDDARSQLAGLSLSVPSTRGTTHVSVAAPLCIWADALTKVVALSGDTSHPLLARHGARAWLH